MTLHTSLVIESCYSFVIVIAFTGTHAFKNLFRTQVRNSLWNNPRLPSIFFT